MQDSNLRNFSPDFLKYRWKRIVVLAIVEKSFQTKEDT
jgi:hypothetical protein